MDFAITNYFRVRAVECARASQPTKSQIGRAVCIRMACVAARLTSKLRPTLAVGFVYVATTTALLAGISRVNLDYRYTGALRLVRQELSQLCERPTVQLCPLALPSPNPRSDAGEFFNGDHSICAFGERDYASRNCVISPPIVTI